MRRPVSSPIELSYEVSDQSSIDLTSTNENDNDDETPSMTPLIDISCNRRWEGTQCPPFQRSSIFCFPSDSDPLPGLESQGFMPCPEQERLIYPRFNIFSHSPELRRECIELVMPKINTDSGINEKSKQNRSTLPVTRAAKRSHRNYICDRELTSWSFIAAREAQHNKLCSCTSLGAGKLSFSREAAKLDKVVDGIKSECVSAVQIGGETSSLDSSAIHDLQGSTCDDDSFTVHGFHQYDTEDERFSLKTDSGNNRTRYAELKATEKIISQKLATTLADCEQSEVPIIPSPNTVLGEHTPVKDSAAKDNKNQSAASSQNIICFMYLLLLIFFLASGLIIVLTCHAYHNRHANTIRSYERQAVIAELQYLRSLQQSDNALRATRWELLQTENKLCTVEGELEALKCELKERDSALELATGKLEAYSALENERSNWCLATVALDLGGANLVVKDLGINNDWHSGFWGDE